MVTCGQSEATDSRDQDSLATRDEPYSILGSGSTQRCKWVGLVGMVVVDGCDFGNRACVRACVRACSAAGSGGGEDKPGATYLFSARRESGGGSEVLCSTTPRSGGKRFEGRKSRGRERERSGSPLAGPDDCWLAVQGDTPTPTVAARVGAEKQREQKETTKPRNQVNEK